MAATNNFNLSVLWEIVSRIAGKQNAAIESHSRKRKILQILISLFAVIVVAVVAGGVIPVEYGFALAGLVAIIFVWVYPANMRDFAIDITAIRAEANEAVQKRITDWEAERKVQIEKAKAEAKKAEQDNSENVAPVEPELDDDDLEPMPEADPDDPAYNPYADLTPDEVPYMTNASIFEVLRIFGLGSEGTMDILRQRIIDHLIATHPAGYFDKKEVVSTGGGIVGNVPESETTTNVGDNEDYEIVEPTKSKRKTNYA
jgi:hypothetical protein